MARGPEGAVHQWSRTPDDGPATICDRASFTGPIERSPGRGADRAPLSDCAVGAAPFGPRPRPFCGAVSADLDGASGCGPILPDDRLLSRCHPTFQDPCG